VATIRQTMEPFKKEGRLQKNSERSHFWLIRYLGVKCSVTRAGLPIVIHSNYFMGVFTLFEGAILIGPSPIVLELWAIPNRITSLDCQLQNRNKCDAPYGLPFPFYILES
jgi:hypothetical protein